MQLEIKAGTVKVKAGIPIAIVFAMLTMFGPVAMDVYLPVLPSLAAELDAGVSATQLTVTACLVGLALGQLLGGPLSDRWGRRIPLLIGIVAFIVASALCAMSQSLVGLIVWRTVQGLAGGVGLVIAQASGRDVYEGTRLTRYYSRIIVISGVAAVAAPVIGGQMAEYMTWRGFFVVLALFGVVVLASVVVALPETLAPTQRTSGGVQEILGNFKVLKRDSLFVWSTVVSSLTSGAYFAYLAGAAFVLQDNFGLSPSMFSLSFAVNALGFAVCGFAAGRVAEKIGNVRVLKCGILIMMAGALIYLLSAQFLENVWVIAVAFLAIAAGAAVVSPPSTTLALKDHPEIAGTAASILGVSRFLVGATAAPLAGLGGQGSMLGLGVVLMITVSGALVLNKMFLEPAAEAN